MVLLDHHEFKFDLINCMVKFPITDCSSYKNVKLDLKLIIYNVTGSKGHLADWAIQKYKIQTKHVYIRIIWLVGQEVMLNVIARLFDQRTSWEFALCVVPTFLICKLMQYDGHFEWCPMIKWNNIINVCKKY